MTEFLALLALFLPVLLVNRVFYGNWAGRPRPRKPYQPRKDYTIDPDLQHCRCSVEDLT